MGRRSPSDPLSRREQQIVDLVVAATGMREYPWFAQVRGSLAVGVERAVIDAINSRKAPRPHGSAKKHLL